MCEYSPFCEYAEWTFCYIISYVLALGHKGKKNRGKKGKMKKRFLSVLLSFVLSASMVMPVLAAEPEIDAAVETVVEEQSDASTDEMVDDNATASDDEDAYSEETEVFSTEEATETSVESETVSETATDENEGDIELVSPEWSEAIPGDYDSNALFEGYANMLFGMGEDELELQAASAYDELNETEKKMYNYMKSQIKEILAGNETSTVFQIPVSTLGIPNEFSVSEVGYTGGDATDACNNIKAKYWKFSATNVLKALWNDMPYEMFWCDYMKGQRTGGDSVKLSKDETKITYPVNSINITLYVTKEYSATGEEGTSVVSATKAKIPMDSQKNAKDIVTQYAGKTDLEKLQGYVQEICNLVSYDESVTGKATQIINVFDGDKNTKASGEGYARAFKFLCDNTTFNSSKINTYLLTGNVKDNSTGNNINTSLHTWNAVKLDNDKVYLVDVALCDEGMIGAPDGLFLAGGETNKFVYSGKNAIQYKNVSCGSASVTYSLSFDMLDTYSDDELTISPTSYFEHETSGLTNDDVKVTWDSSISNVKETYNGKSTYIIGYTATIKCKCARCIKESADGKDIVVDSGRVTVTDNLVAKQPSCDEDGMTKAGPYIEKDFLGKGTKRKVAIPATKIEKYGSHDMPDAWVLVNSRLGIEERQCKRSGCSYIERRYTKGEEPVCVVPTGLTADYGQKVKDIALVNPAGNTEGTWTWEDVTSTTTVGDAGEHTFYASFMPNDTDKYHPVERKAIKVTVNKIEYDGTKSVDASLGKLAGCLESVKLPALPAGAAYGTITNPKTDKITAALSEDKTELVLTSKGIDTDDKVTISIAVTGATNYKDYAVTVNVTPKEHVHAINKLKYHKAVAPTKEKDGFKEYYECSNGCTHKLKSDGTVATDEELFVARLDITVVVDANGGTFANGDTVKTYKVKYQGTMPSIDSVSLAGCTFDGYATDMDGESKRAFLSTVDFTDDIYVFAVWNRADVKVTFMNADIKYSTLVVRSGTSYDTDNRINKEVTKFPEPKPVADKIFLGWFDGDNEFTSDTVVTSAKTVYAKWATKGMTISLYNDTVDFTGSQVKPVISSITFDGVNLVEGTDYTVSYKNNTKAYDLDGKTDTEKEKYAPAVVITGKGNYAGTYKKYFSIAAKNLRDADITVADIDTVIETGKDYKPTPAVTWGKTKLVNNRDYVIEYYKITGEGEVAQTPKEEGKYILYLKEKDGSNYTGTSLGKRFNIASSKSMLISKLSITYPKTVPYDEKEHKLKGSEIVIKDGKDQLKEITDYEVVYPDDDYTNVGTKTVVISGHGKYAGSKIITYQVTGTPLSKVRMTGFVTSKNYDNGNAVTQNVTFTPTGEEPLIGKSVSEYNALSASEKKKVGYTYEYFNHFDIGTATVIYHGVNKYYGDVKKTYVIKGENISAATISGDTLSFTYDGNAKVQDEESLKILDKNKNELKWTTSEKYADIKSPSEKRAYDCLVSYMNNTNAGTSTMIITGINKYYGTKKKTYKINQYDFKTGADISISIKNSYEYDKSGVCPEPEVYFGYTKLTKGIDYTVSYANNKNLSDGTGNKAPVVKITGKGNFKGVKESAPFKITAKVLNERDFKIVVADKTATGKAGNWKSTVSVVDANGKKLSLNSDYSKVEYRYGDIGGRIYDGSVKGNPQIVRGVGDLVGDKDIVPADTEIVVAVYGNGKNGYYTSMLTTTYRVGKTDINSLKFTIDPKAYTGFAVTLSEDDITWKSGVIQADVTFVIDRTSYKNNVKKGKATVVVKGTGDYCGTRTLTFTIGSRTLK